MSARNKFVKVRLSLEEYADVAKRADEQGLTMCEHIRQQLLQVHETLDMRQELRALRDQVASAAPAAGRDAQILSRVRAQLANGRAV